MAPTARKLLIPLAVATALGGLASNAVAGGFAIGTQSGSGTGNAFAGGAAAADDASVAWSNPAGMSLLPAGKQVAGALHILKPSFKFTNNGSTGVFAGAGTGEGGDGGDWAFVPNGFFTIDINPKMRFGLALNAPFGLKTEYDSGWRGRLTALLSEVKSVNINPSVAYKVSDTVSIGAGVSVQKLDAKLTNDATVLGLGIVTIDADDVGYGFNLGAMFQPSPSTRIGAHYRSSIKYDLEGTLSASLSAPAGSNIKADLKVPDSFSVSAFHALDSKWELMGDITWTGWSSVQQLAIVRTSGAMAGATFTTLQFQWDDTWRYGVGANYKWDNQTKIRFGLAFDETPTKDATRTPRLPDQDRTWVAFGVQFRPSKTGILDVGYAHEFIKNANVNTSGAPAPGTLVGTFKNKADIFSIQYSHSF
jgi:long-chain fatty acid transport protein